MIWKTTNCRGEPVTWYSEDEIQKEREYMSRVKHLIGSLGELYKKIFEQESTNKNSVDFYLDLLEEQAEANRKIIDELGYWTEE